MNPLQEAISEAASNHSVDSSLDEDEVDQAGDELDDPNIIDNLSDMVSANVSGRGTPNVSGRDTPSSQVRFLWKRMFNKYFPKYAGQKKCGITVESLLETFSARFWPCILKGKLIFTAPTALSTAEGRFGLLKTREAATWIIPTLHFLF